jgi:hypothetical protein
MGDGIQVQLTSDCSGLQIVILTTIWWWQKLGRYWQWVNKQCTEFILSCVGWYMRQKWQVLVRMIGFISTLVTTSLNYSQYRQYSTIADLRTLHFITAHALGFPVFTSRLLAMDLNTETITVSLDQTRPISLHYSARKAFKSHIKSTQADLLHSSVFLVPIHSASLWLTLLHWIHFSHKPSALISQLSWVLLNSPHTHSDLTLKRYSLYRHHMDNTENKSCDS